MEGDYSKNFDPVTFLKLIYNHDLTKLPIVTRDRILFPMQCYHELFATCEFMDKTNLSFLDLGSGPALVPLISAAPHVASITMSDYAEGNRLYLKDWVEKNAEFDWMPYFDYVVSYLESNKDIGAVEKRMERVRNAIKAVVSCDFIEESIIEGGHEGPYDIVHTSLTVCVTAKSLSEYKNQVKKISGLVKPGGKLIIFEAERKQLGGHYAYEFGNCSWPYIGVTREFVVECLEAVGFDNIYIKTVGVAGDQRTNYMFFAATKKM